MIYLGISGTHISAQTFLAALRANEVAVRDLNGPDDAAGIETLLLAPRDVMESERLLFEDEAYARRLPSLKVLVLSGTLSPRYVRALRDRVPARIEMIDAPLVGAPRAIASGQATFLLGGRADLIDSLQPLFSVLSRGQTRMGEFGTAMTAKALQDCITAASSAMARSALDWAEAQGIEESRLLSFLKATLARQLPPGMADPASLVTNTLPGDNAGAVLVKNVEAALDTALAGVHLNPPRMGQRLNPTQRTRHLH